MKQNVLVTGSTGFIGKNLVEKISSTHVLHTPTHLEKDLERESEEEMGVSPRDIVSKRFVGLFSNPFIGNSDLEFCYLVKTKLPAVYFTSGNYKINAKHNEHERFIEISTYGQIKQLLENGILHESKEKSKIPFSTRGTLDSIKPGEMK